MAWESIADAENENMEIKTGENKMKKKKMIERRKRKGGNRNEILSLCLFFFIYICTERLLDK